MVVYRLSVYVCRTEGHVICLRLESKCERQGVSGEHCTLYRWSGQSLGLATPLGGRASSLFIASHQHGFPFNLVAGPSPCSHLHPLYIYCLLNCVPFYPAEAARSPPSRHRHTGAPSSLRSHPVSAHAHELVVSRLTNLQRNALREHPPRLCHYRPWSSILNVAVTQVK